MIANTNWLAKHMTLLDQLNQTIYSGLMRRSVTQCSDWASTYRIMGRPIPGPFSFKYHPWLKEMHDSKAVKNVGQKSAQMGFTECVLNRTLFKIDVERTDCLYVLPNKSPDASDFSSARFDAALDLSEHLEKLFSDVRNVGHKRAGSTNLYIRGSRSRGGMKSIPVGFMVLDEFDEMDMAQVVLAVERMSGQFEKQLWEISTPTIPDWGINKELKESTQEHWFFVCPHCSRKIELTFAECLIVTADSVNDSKIHDSYIQCPKCKGKLDHAAKHVFLQDGEWVPTADRYDWDVRGFYVNQLYSSTITPVDLARAYIRAQLDPADEQEYFNSKQGLPHVVEGARVTDTQIEQAKGNYTMYPAHSGGLVTLGVDVGNWLHYEVDEWHIDTIGPDINTDAKCRVLAVGKVKSFEDLDKLMRDFQIQGCVIDIFPERRKAKEFADRFYGFVKLCYYGRGVASKGIKIPKEDEFNDHQITVDRTSWLDLSLGRFMGKSITLPYDIPEEYSDHIKNQVRIYKKDEEGNPQSKYVTTGPDHYGHARNYAEIALPLAASIATSSDIKDFL